MEKLRAQLMEDRIRYDNDKLQPDINLKFGHIAGVPVGTKWATRDSCSKSLVHTQRVAGISGSPKYGAYSVVLSGAYEDDQDKGESFIYTGTGGRANGGFGGTGPQVEDQTFDHPDNEALRVSSITKRPVRVVRGTNPDSRFAPSSGYRYDGLYIVESAYLEKGKSGFMVCRFNFQRMKDGQPPLP